MEIENGVLARIPDPPLTQWRSYLLGKGDVSTVCGSVIDNTYRGLAWSTQDSALRAKFEEFGQVEEAVSLLCVSIKFHQKTDILQGSGQGPRYWSQPWFWLHPLCIGGRCRHRHAGHEQRGVCDTVTKNYKC